VTTAACVGTDAVARNQFRMFDRIGNEAALTDEDRRRMLRLSAQQWLAWSGLRNGGAVPVLPALPVMLRRLGAASHRLVVAAERRGEAARTQAPELAAAA
jgi:hypothetical protein